MRAGSRPWFAWPLVALSAVPVVGLVLVARRVLSGETTLFGPADVDLPFRERAGLLLNVSGAETLVVPLLALGLVAWLARSASQQRPSTSALWAAAGVAAATAAVALGHCLLIGYLALSDPPSEDQGFSFGQVSLLELFGPRGASAGLLAVLAAALAAVLVIAARHLGADEGELLDDEPAEDEPLPLEDDPLPPPVEPEPVVSQPATPAGDPHARFRRPS